MSNSLKLTGKFKILDISLKTRANGWKNIKPGDI